MPTLYIASTQTMILDSCHRYTHPITGIVYGGTDYDNPAKCSEIGAVPLTLQEPSPGMSPDGWEIVEVIGGYLRRPTGETILPPPTPPPQEFTKLAIRRAMRRLGIESQLDALLSASPLFKSDWADATAIDLSDPMTVLALASASIDVSAVIAEILKG